MKLLFTPDEATRQAATHSLQIQDAVNLRAIVAQMLADIDSLRAAKLDGNRIINHPVVLAYVSKLCSLCRFTHERETAALIAVGQLAEGRDAMCEVLPL